MSSILNELISSSGPFFDSLMKSLETATRNQFIDVDLVGEIITKSNNKIRELKLTPGDILPEEIYQALLAKLAKDAKKVNYQIVGESIGVKSQNNQIRYCLKRIVDDEVFALKDKKIIQFIKENPPVKMLEYFKIKSEDTLLKKYSAIEILYIANKVEGKKWHNKFIKLIQDLKFSDFEFKKFNLIEINEDFKELFVHVDEIFFDEQYLLGVMFYNLPDKENIPFEVIVKFLEEYQNFVDNNNQMQIYANSYKFTEILQKITTSQTVHVWNVQNNPLPWRSIYRNFAHNSELNNLLKQYLPEVKLISFKPVKTLTDQFKELKFWKDSDYLCFKYGHIVVSYNLLDIYKSANGLTMKFGQTNDFEDALWDELLNRYFKDFNLSNQIMMQLKNKIIL